MKRRVRLRSETLRRLETAEIRGVAGGAPRPPVTETCHTASCPGDYTCECPF